MNLKRMFQGVLLAAVTTPWMSTLALADDIPSQTRKFAMTPQAHYEHLMKELYTDLTVIGVVFSIVTLYFLFAYRRKSADHVGAQPKLSTQQVLGWLLIPSMLFLADDLYLFAKAADLHDNMRSVPKDAYEIKATGQMWSWTYEYPNGVTTTNELVVPQGKAVLLRLSSTDVVHSHFLAGYHVTEDAVPGRATYEWFLPDQVGESVVTCREYCGMLHSGMYGKVRVVTPADFENWLGAQVAAMAPAAPAAPAK